MDWFSEIQNMMLNLDTEKIRKKGYNTVVG